MSNTLKNLISEIISEIAVTPKIARENQFALFTNGRFFVLYDPEIIKQNLNKLQTFTRKQFKMKYTQFIGEAYTSNAIVGFISISKPVGCSVFKISLSAAKKGYGPLIYDIALSSQGSLMPDRVVVSPSATNIWKYYNEKRSDILKTKLPKSCSKHEIENMPELDLKYTATKTVSDMKLRHNHINFIKWLREQTFINKGGDISTTTLDANLIHAGLKFYEIQKKGTASR